MAGKLESESDGSVRVKVRETTREATFTIPHSEERKMKFFFEEEWDELHVVHSETKVVLAVYSRNQVIAMLCRHGVKRVKHRSGDVVNVLPV